MNLLEPLFLKQGNRSLQGRGHTTTVVDAPKQTTNGGQIDARTRLLPGLVAIVGGLIQLAYTRLGGFYFDDIRNLGQAKAGLSLHLLMAPIEGVHFQPGGRFIQWLVAEPLHTNYLAAETLLATFTAIGAYLLVRLLDTSFSPRPLHLIIGFLFASSWLLLNTDQWFSGADTVPAVTLAIGACLGFCLWLRGSGLAPLVAALLATIGAVLFWEQALAIPAWLLLIWICFARDTKRSVRQVILVLTLFGMVSLAFLAYAQTQPWHQTLSFPPLGEWRAWFQYPVFHGVLPTLAGSGTALTSRSGGGLVAGIGLAVLAAWLVIHRRFRWSSLAFFVLGSALVVAPVAMARGAPPTLAYYAEPGLLGPQAAGTTVRYIVFLLFVLAVAVAGAVRSRPVDRHSSCSMKLVSKWAGGVLAVALGALYLINLHATAQTNWFSERSGKAAAGYSAQVGAGLSALGRDQRDSVVDSVLPSPVWYATSDGLNELSNLMPFWSSRVQAIGEGPRLTALDPSGTLRWAAFHPSGTGPLDVRVIVSALAPTTITVRITAVTPTEPEVPWHIKVGPGTHSFTLPAWSTGVQSVTIHGARALGIETGTVSLGNPVVSSRST
jgi:hypothetical protein